MQAPPLIPANWNDFPDQFRERLGVTAGRQRCMKAEDHLLIIAHQVPEPDEAQRRAFCSGWTRWGSGNPPTGTPVKLP